MLVKNEHEVGACIQNGKPCALLIGYYSEEEWHKWHPNEPYQAPNVSCHIGFECGRGVCFRYEAK
jgi:hypothetical protein